MTIEEAIRSYLTSSPYPLTVGARVYSHRAPQTPTQPYLVFYRVSPEPIHSQSGPSQLMQRTYQFSIYSSSQAAALSIGDALRTLLNGYSGMMGDVLVSSVLWRTDRMLWEDDTKLHHNAIDMRFQYRET